MNNDEKKLIELTNYVSELAYHYYVLDKPLVSDAEYDKYFDELIALEKKIGKVLPNSLTQRVGGSPLSKFEKVEHKFPLLSLNKSQNFEELEKFYNDLKKILPDAMFSVEYKFDGLRLVLHYENGELVRAATRGNGITGEDVTLQIKTIKTVPLKIKFKEPCIIEGEGIMFLSNLKKYNSDSDEPLKNARNAVAGAIRNLDPKITAKRKIDFVAYSVYCRTLNFEKQSEINNFLKENGFYVGDFFEVCRNFSELKESVTKIENSRFKLNVLIDGAVIKLEQIKKRDLFGETSRFPKWAIAYKFAPEEISTKLNNIVWQVGRSGKLTPIGEVEPVELAGATVKRATLNNYSDILKKKVRIGAKVFIRRSNEVIPEILGIAGDENAGQKPIEPTACPCCGSALEKVGPNLFCFNNKNCSDQLDGKLVHFTSKNGMNIEGFSDKTAIKFRQDLNIKELHELFKIKKEELLKLESFKDKKAENILNAIEKSKNVKLHNFIYALAIPQIGIKTAKDLARHFKTLENLISAKYEDFMNIENIGEIMAEEIVRFFSDNENKNEIKELIDSGINIINPETKKTENAKLNGLKFVITGAFTEYKRDELVEIIETAGGQVLSAISKNVDFLLAGEDAGSKLTKAQALKLKIISLDEFKKMI